MPSAVVIVLVAPPTSLLTLQWGVASELGPPPCASALSLLATLVAFPTKKQPRALYSITTLPTLPKPQSVIAQ